MSFAIIFDHAPLSLTLVLVATVPILAPTMPVLVPILYSHAHAVPILAPCTYGDVLALP